MHEQYNVSGVNEIGLDRMATDIIEYADKLNNIFNQLQILVDNSKNYFNSEVNQIFCRNFKKQAEYYQIINQNILSYASDFVKVKQSYKVGAENIADNILANNRKWGGK